MTSASLHLLALLHRVFDSGRGKQPVAPLCAQHWSGGSLPTEPCDPCRGTEGDSRNGRVDAKGRTQRHARQRR